MKKKLIIGSIIAVFAVSMVGVYFVIVNSKGNTSKASSSTNAATKSSASDKKSSSSTSSGKVDTTYNDDGKDVVVKDDTFLAQMNDIFDKTDNYIGRKITVEGIVQSIDDGNFAVARKFDEKDGDHYDEVMVGIISSYSGEMPKADSWVEVTGTISKKTVQGSEQPVINVDKVTVKDTRGQEKIYD